MVKSFSYPKKDLLLSGKVLTIVVLIIFPSSYIMFSIFTGFLRGVIFILPQRLLSSFFPITVVPFSMIPILIILLVFAFIPAIYSTPKFFNKRGFENVVIEYRYMKKILYFSILTLIVLILLYIYLNYQFGIVFKNDISKLEEVKKINNQLENISQQIINTSNSKKEQYERITNLTSHNQQFKNLAIQLSAIVQPELDFLFPLNRLIVPIYIALFLILPVPISILIKLLLEHGRKQFKLYYAKGCFKIISKETTDEVEKAKYLAIGLTWYNRFLKRNTNLQINDVTKIYSKIVTHSPLDTNKALISISKSFNSEDGLKPLRYLSVFFPDTEVGQILTKEALTTRIKESSDLVIPIITTIITVITTFILKKP